MGDEADDVRVMLPESQVESTEEEHTHYCELCGSTWSHQDAECDGPRFVGYYGSGYDCPLCEEVGR